MMNSTRPAEAQVVTPYVPFEWCSVPKDASVDRRTLCSLVNTVMDVALGAAVVIDLTQECESDEVPVVSITDIGCLNRLAFAALRLLHNKAEALSVDINKQTAAVTAQGNGGAVAR